METRNINTLKLTFSLFALALTSCGGDDPKPPPNGSTGPTQIVAVNGTVYKAVMGGSGITPELKFAAQNASNANFPDQWLFFLLIEGDGTLTADSLRTDSSGTATLGYSFDGVLGHAVIRSILRNKDTINVRLRANILITGVNGQGQYVLFTDLYRDVKAFNGPPASDDEHPTQYIQFANYEAALGIVVIITDANQNIKADDDEPVQGVIVNTVYTGKLEDSVGIGSGYTTMINALGQPDTTYVDNSPPPARVFEYDNRGLTIYARPADSVIFEMHLVENVAAPSPEFKKSSFKPGRGRGLNHSYHPQP
ncbi:MAG: hypothetical protein SGI97_08625 [candidate division Zixibacteria bacterium]|nr:hypothetical protein [candidate division Zixibacteria bacterium]